MRREKPGNDSQPARPTYSREPEPIRTQAHENRACGREGEGLFGQDAPGTRSGEGTSSVMDQMHKDHQRNANQADGTGEDLPQAARDSTA
jgi:hypothetical protein